MPQSLIYLNRSVTLDYVASFLLLFYRFLPLKAHPGRSGMTNTWQSTNYLWSPLHRWAQVWPQHRYWLSIPGPTTKHLKWTHEIQPPRHPWVRDWKWALTWKGYSEMKNMFLGEEEIAVTKRKSSFSMKFIPGPEEWGERVWVKGRPEW